MNRNRVLTACAIPALTVGMMTPAERAKGRFMRAPDDLPPPPESGTGGNNPTGNSGEGGNVTPPADNTGAADDLSQFWGNQDDGTGNTESLTPEQEQQQQQALGSELKTAIESFAPPAPVFTKETAEQIAEGNFEGINKIMSQAHQATIQQSLLLTSKLVGAVVKRMQADFDSRIQSNLGQRDSTQFLTEQFPLAKDPAFAPMVQRVWNQALSNAKGDKQQAIRLTRGMLEAFGEKTSPSVREAASDPTAGINTAASRSLVESLLDRG